MASNPKRKGNAASTSFRADEVRAAVAIHNTLLRSGDARGVLLSAAGRRLMLKFLRMRESLDEGRSGV